MSKLMDEYAAFATLTEGLARATEGARRLGTLRPDQPWPVVAQALLVCRESAFRLAGEGALKKQ